MAMEIRGKTTSIKKLNCIYFITQVKLFALTLTHAKQFLFDFGVTNDRMKACVKKQTTSNHQGQLEAKPQLQIVSVLKNLTYHTMSFMFFNISYLPENHIELGATQNPESEGLRKISRDMSRSKLPPYLKPR